LRSVLGIRGLLDQNIQNKTSELKELLAAHPPPSARTFFQLSLGATCFSNTLRDVGLGKRIDFYSPNQTPGTEKTTKSTQKRKLQHPHEKPITGLPSFYQRVLAMLFELGLEIITRGGGNGNQREVQKLEESITKQGSWHGYIICSCARYDQGLSA